MSKLIVLTIIMFTCLTCKSKVNDDYVHFLKYKNNISYRDSTLLKYVINFLINDTSQVTNLNCYFVGYNEDIGHKYFSISYGNIYYSPDSLKALAYYFISMPNYGDVERTYYNEPEKWYSTLPFALIRDSIYQPWEVYFLDQYRPTGWDKSGDIFILMENYYHKEILFDSETIKKPEISEEDLLNDTVIYPKKFDANDVYINVMQNRTKDQKDFWDSSIIWTKGLRRKGYYNFQTSTHVVSKDQLIEYYIKYPDSIINMYKKP